ncbi:hypothetical protein [Trichococcus sp.]|uniref:hypothetical protein n=1 Tax=Trichococcus sp. TaxID=1985464 RepID=UPI003C7C1D3A
MWGTRGKRPNRFFDQIITNRQRISGHQKEYRRFFTHVTLLKDVLLVLAKALLSLLSLSGFMLANALCSSGMGIARFVALQMPEQDTKSKRKSYRRVGIIITGASSCYSLYSLRLFYGENTRSYPLNLAVLIAAYTFILFGINLRGAIKLRYSQALEAKALRGISLSSTLLCFSLTQTAIMSAAHEGDYTTGSATASLLFGSLACLIGLRIIKDSYDCRYEDRKQS